MKILKVVFTSLFFFVFLASGAFADISITLPKSISAERLVKVFQEADKAVPDVAVEVSVEYSYEPGSVKRVPERFVIYLYSNEKFLGLFRRRDNFAFIRIELTANKNFRRIKAKYPYSNWPEFNTMNLSKKERTELEGLLKEIYKRLQAK